MPEKKDSLKEKAYTIIKKKITNCEYLPGEFLNEKKLIEEIGASRTPIREALNKIEQENLVKIIPKRGVMVGEITMKDISEIFQVRECIEPYVVKNCIHFYDEVVLKDYKRKFEKLENQVNFDSYANFYNVDNEFHLYLISTCKNKYFDQTMESVYIQNQRVRLIVGKVGYRITATKNEHLHLIDALLSHDEEKAVQCITKHISESKAIAFQKFMNFTI